MKAKYFEINQQRLYLLDTNVTIGKTPENLPKMWSSGAGGKGKSKLSA